MKQINVNYITEKLVEKYGINLRGDLLSDRLEIRPTDIEYGVGFILKVKLEWRSLTAEFIPDNFAAGLIKTMGASDSHKKAIFKLLAQRWSSNTSEYTNKLYLKINGEEVSPQDPIHWSSNWSHLYIKLTKTPVIHGDLDNKQLENAFLNISCSLLGLILSLLPLEEVAIEEGAVGLPEGALKRIEVNRYERSTFNRQACLTFHGYICKVCEFDFKQKYGKLGEGFIHIHHIIPVSELGSNYKVNPETDLVPICPNCHAMIHRRNPPYTVDELKNIISLNIKVGKD
ncbi:HNH endonuclease [Bacillus inaquosorum]|uniref:HNH endonuclease n=1 Tax=Bacillus inaquosorum TaxID=483913 RepID=UPI00228259C5|nr:HNH endonuclease [Bacillus inaquosorum]MCY7905577.1 HNH endonuclease [Bacillus inaquosorum]MCY7929478.1 HNH endonuclease [Bacillus inaquosorum]MCY8768535.1 HNH endonuclease [Bacillus inaquosorum]MCY9049676.1 HNH endonuclease [Bacillus inaquosorum]